MGELLKIRLLDNHLLDTFGRKSTARHKIYQLLESSKCLLNWIQADDKKTTLSAVKMVEYFKFEQIYDID